MTSFKKKLFLPLCLSGVLIGYGASEWVVPRYFQPTSETTLTPTSLINALGSQREYYRKTISGNYLAGQFAQRRKDWEQAHNFIGSVLEKTPNNEVLRSHSMVLSMASGDTKKAISIAKEVSKDPENNLLATLFVALDDFKKENYKDAKQTLKKVEQNSIASFLVPVLKLWADTNEKKLDVTNFSPSSFYAYQTLLAANYLNKSSEGLQSTAIEYALTAFAVSENDIRDLEKAADLFAHLGEKEKAEELYKAIQKNGFTSDKIEKKLSLLEEGQSIKELLEIPTINSPKQGAGIVFYDMAEILFREYSDDSAIIFAQMALYLNPELEKAHIMIGNIQTRHDRVDDAITQYKKIKPDSDLYVIAQRQIADLYAEQKEDSKAIDILKSLYRDYEDINALIQIGDIYRYQEDFKSAIKSYNQVIDLWDDVPEEYWHVLYVRGMAYERLKEFKKSEIDLQKALEFRPNHPYVLNYLGYSWVDQGVHLNKSLDMIKKATLLKPNDGYIADSLGWAYYKMGEIEEGLIHLERAVELLPYDATINDHLGDAYWRVGRKLEARFQWRRAVNYSDEHELEMKDKIIQKIKTGLLESDNLPPETKTGAIEEHSEDNSKPAL